MLYLISDQLPVFVPLGLIAVYRYLWYSIRIIASLAYRPIPVPERPTYLAEEDVTVIVPTVDPGDWFMEAARTWLANNPREIIIVTEESIRHTLERLALEIDGPFVDPDERDGDTSSHSSSYNRTLAGASGSTVYPPSPLPPHKRGRIRVIAVPQANKRIQMSAGIQAAKTDIIVFADDDALWPTSFLPNLLAPFEDASVGGVGTSQVVRPCAGADSRYTIWETLAAMRLSIRNIEIAAAQHIDGGCPCISGRTSAYRSLILRDPAFLHGFTHDYWRGKYLLNSGDDKFLTRWMVSHGWGTYVQCCDEAEIRSTMKPDWRFLRQVLRWTRNTWRSDLRSIFVERYIWTRHPYVAYTMIDKFLNPFTLLAGPALVLYLMIRSAKGNVPYGFHLPAWNIAISYIVWLLATRSLKLLPHLWRRPGDIVFVPVWLAFGYYFAIMKLYALATLHVTDWGTREGVKDPATATAAARRIPTRNGSLKMSADGAAHAPYKDSVDEDVLEISRPSDVALADGHGPATARSWKQEMDLASGWRDESTELGIAR